MKVPAPIANGIRTDHPIPGLPFVDDSLLPITDPRGIEKIGRGTHKNTWGREDTYNSPANAWRAFTTDPTHTDYGWLVIHHPDNGTTILLYPDKTVIDAYTYQDYTNEGVIPLAVRAGGYWSDGNTWHRPTRTTDPITSDTTWDTPTAPRTITADEALAITGATTPPGSVYTLAEFAKKKPGTEPYPTWVEQSLSTWAKHRDTATQMPLERCIIDLESPELEPKNLSDNAESAHLAGVEASTWRAYVSRGTAPTPQQGWLGDSRPQWARPVINAWIAQRDRDESRQALTSDVDEYTEPIVDYISESISQIGRKPFTTKGSPDAVRAALRRRVVGLALYPHIPADMTAAWMVDQFNPTLESLGDQTGDQVVSLMWLDPWSGEQALQRFISKGVERGYARESLERALRGISQVRDSQALSEQVELAIAPRWGE